MRKLGIFTLILMVGAGMLAMGACGGGGSDGDGLPRSSPAYAGSSMPAMVDSTTYWSHDGLYGDMESWIGDFTGGVKLGDDPPSGSDPYSGTSTVTGSISGTYVEAWSGVESWTPTTSSDVGQYKGTYSDYADSGDQPPYVLKGSGSWEHRYDQQDLYDGVEGPQGIGTLLSDSYMAHFNYAAFAESTSGTDDNYSGYLTRTTSNGYGDDSTWSETEVANIARNNLTSGTHVGLLNYSSTEAWDGSFSTFVGSGTLCLDGEEPFEGCLDFDIDLSWDWDISTCYICSYPDSGTMTVSPSGGTGSGVYEYDNGVYTYTLYAADGVSVLFSTQVGDN